ncbi:hypothetical protein AOQ71_29160 [Bradyrhizobium manausense]|uniref:VRR-NUC domain-containing protein n=2 Tax=Bradyrhizobium manausense TaxID=989370 RepID=A0A0R3D540_9BRAD|nr:hypothetical protein AOQ71_29160 [Bradyrhizobium manausense]
MAADGFVVAAFDGCARQAGTWNALPKPFALRGRRPDAFGINADGILAFCEAKTGKDLMSPRTREQFAIFGRLRIKGSSARCPLYVAVPREDATLLDEALSAAGVIGARNVFRLHVPEVLLRGRHAA